MLFGKTFNKKSCLGLIIKNNEKNKKLVTRIKKSSGRNNQGRITVRHRGGGYRKLYRLVDFKREKKYLQIKNVIYDPRRTAYIADCFSCYILLFNNYCKNRILKSISGLKNPLEGDCTELKYVPVGLEIHNIELKPGKGGQLVRSSGNSAKLLEKIGCYAKIQFTSGEVRLINLKCRATVGTLLSIKQKKKKKAGESRWVGIKPSVRGVAMNPVDHPHGGGEGKTSGGRHPVSFSGRLTKGVPTRRFKKRKNILYSVQECKFGKRKRF